MLSIYLHLHRLDLCMKIKSRGGIETGWVYVHMGSIDNSVHFETRDVAIP